MNRSGVPQPPSANNNNSGWARDTSLSTKCMNCSQILLYPAGEKTVRCPSCKAILDVEHAESSVLRPCVGCSTMLGNPTNALKVLCPLCKTTMDWSKPPPSVQQMQAQAAADVKAQLKEKLTSKSDAPVINLEEEKTTEKDAATSTTNSTSDSNSAPVAKENEDMAEAENEKANEDEKSNDESVNDKETTNDKEESKATTTESNGKEPEKEVEAEKS